MERLTTKCSTILIAVGEETRVYHSVEDIPDELREKLLASTHGGNSATILIADRGGREKILNALRRSQESRYGRVAAAMPERQKPAGRYSRWIALLPIAARILLLTALGCLLWVLATLR